MKTSAVERARRYVAKCPPAISGQEGHNVTFHVAAILMNGFALSEWDGMTVLSEWNRGCVPPWSEAELVHKIRSAVNATDHKPRGWMLEDGEERCQKSEVGSQLPTRVKKPVFRPETLKRVAGKLKEIPNIIEYIAERSPVRVDTQDSASVLRRLYRRKSGEKVLLFNDMESQGQMLWEADRSDTIQNRYLPTGPNGIWILPQPVCGAYLPNPRLGGKMSRRSEEAVTSWRYLVLESDQAEAEDWLRCLAQMPLRIACICESGGRSVHAWVRLDAPSKTEWDERVRAIKPILITLGADRGALSAVRLSRLPQATRGERVQRLLYLNSEPEGGPILRQAVRENRNQGGIQE